MGRDYSEAATYSLTAEELTQKIIAGDLEEGAVYEVTDHLSLYFGGISAETVFDLKNICIRTSPSGYSYDGPNPLGEGRFAIFVEGTTAPITFKNFTLEVSAWDGSDLTPEEVINTWNCAGLTLENAEIKGVTNHAVHSVNSKEGAETRLIGCRIDGAFSGGAVAFHDNSGGAAAGTPSVTGSCIVNAADNAGAIIDINSSGAFLMNNAITAKGTAVQLGCSEAVVQNNVIAGGVEISDGLQNVLVALNQVTGGIGVLNGKNAVILLNKVDSIAATGGVSLTLAENTVSGGVSAQKVDYLLMQDNAVTGEILTTDSTNTYGDDLFDPDVRKENGVNEELLPKTNVEVFAGMTHKTTVRTEDEVQTLKRYLNLSARNNTYAIIPPGLYTADALALAGVDVGSAMIGENLLDVVEKKDDNRPNEVFAQISESRVGRCVRTADYLYSVYAPGVNGGEAAASDVYADDFLYDLKADPWQLNNVVADPAYAQVKADMRGRLLDWIEKAEGYRPTITD